MEKSNGIQNKKDLQSSTFDYVIIGGGPGGLYCAKRIEEECLCQRKGLKKIRLIERKHVLGGRTRMEYFHSRLVNTGAGVGRMNKDTILKSLVQNIVPKIQSFPANVCYDIPDPVDTLEIIETLKKKKKEIVKNRHTKTFKQFFLSHFAFRIYHRFCVSNGYTDFENADIVDTIDHYGFDDNISGALFFRVPWNKLTQYLKSCLKQTTVSLRREMTSYEYDPALKLWCIHIRSTSSSNVEEILYTKNLVFAGFLEKNMSRKYFADQIGLNPFLRAYTYSKKYTVLPKNCSMIFRDDMFQKTVPISRHVEMLSYADNQHALSSKKYFERIEKSSTSLSVKHYFWEGGTHYYRPLHTQWKSRKDFIRYAQNPVPGLFLVGEIISNNQGWTEGAFESVEAVLSKLVGR